MSRQQGGGGGGGSGGGDQQELAEIFDQDLTRLANRYETANQSSEQPTEREVDELLEKLKELARRQEGEAERQRLRALQGQGGGGGGGAQGRELAEQAGGSGGVSSACRMRNGGPALQEAARQARGAADICGVAAGGSDCSSSQAGRRLRSNSSARPRSACSSR